VVAYQYRCEADGLVEVTLPMGAATPTLACPRCLATAARVYVAPRLSFGDAAARAAIERCARSADEPDVVSRPPARRSAPLRPRPAWRRLPRP
jgi:hypothetical protein